MPRWPAAAWRFCPAGTGELLCGRGDGLWTFLGPYSSACRRCGGAAERRSRSKIGAVAMTTLFVACGGGSHGCNLDVCCRCLPPRSLLLGCPVAAALVLTGPLASGAVVTDTPRLDLPAALERARVHSRDVADPDGVAAASAARARASRGEMLPQIRVHTCYALSSDVEPGSIQRPAMLPGAEAPPAVQPSEKGRRTDLFAGFGRAAAVYRRGPFQSLAGGAQSGSGRRITGRRGPHG